MITARNVYCIGIGGIGISALAQLLAKRGVSVSGSDAADSEIVTRLRRQHVRVTVGTKAILPPRTDLVIFSPAVPPQHRLRLTARRQGIRTIAYPQALWEELHDQRVIAVAGTHGKTTVTSLIGWFLTAAKKDPTIVVGSIMLNGNTNARRGRGGIAVIEADEFARSFHAYHPDTIVVNNIEPDHFDTYPTRQSLQASFRQFVSQLRPKGMLVVNRDNAMSRQLVKTNTVTFGLGTTRFRSRHIRTTAKGTSFTLNGVRFVSPLFGVHNVLNVAAAVATVAHYGVTVRQCARALRHFKGTWRRFEKVGTYHGLTVISDYAHHPTEITATLQAARQRFPKQPVTVIFQPHQHNRTQHLHRAFAQALSVADAVIVTEIFAVTGRLRQSERRVTAQTIARECTAPVVVWAPTTRQVLATLDKLRAAHGIILCLGAGSIDQFARKLVKS